jgi:aminoglycoside phosphotransferase (APT) family kinase protein
MNRDAALSSLLSALDAHYPGWGVSSATLAGEGLEFKVYRAESPALGPIAIRVAPSRRVCNENDADIDTRALLEQEAALLRHARGLGLPVPRVHALHESEACDFLVREFLESDSLAPSPRRSGQILARLHRAAAPEGICLVAQGERGLEATLAERLSRRAAVVERRAGISLHLPGQESLERSLVWPGARRALLHMDFRPANLLSRGGEVVGVVDWSNALIGDPALELARIAEYGILDAEFLEGYGDRAPLDRAPPGVQALYRLDSAIMLAVVFLSEQPDEDAARRQIPRVIELARFVG